MRTLTAPAIAALGSPDVPMALLLELGYSTVIYANSSAVTIDHAGHAWLGAGALGSVDAVRDSSGEMTGLKFTLSGVPTENIALALTESARNKSCKLYLAILDPATHAVLDAPLIFSGVLDQMPISEGQGSSTLGVTAIHVGQLFSRPKPLRYTDGDQQRLYPGDTSMRFLNSQSQHKDVWPAASWGRR